MNKPLFLLTSLTVFLASCHSPAQEKQSASQKQAFSERKVKERSTVDVLHGNKVIARDVYDNDGNKTDAWEIYEGSRKLSRFNWKKGEWEDINTTTHFSFKYDRQGRQVEQEDHDYMKNNDNLMYRYDKHGNIERWRYGRSFQTALREEYEYDSLGNEKKEIYYYWRHDYRKGRESKDSVLDNLVTDFFLGYDAHGNLTSSVANFVDRMSGAVWYYAYDSKGRVIKKTERDVWSYFGLAGPEVTLNDTNTGRTAMEWNYTYRDDGSLLKEVKREFGDMTYETEFLYNEKGQLISTFDAVEGYTDYIYNVDGLLAEQVGFYDFEKKRMREHLRYEYFYR